jgi:hypothetical protein
MLKNFGLKVSEPRRMVTILVPVDGSKPSDRAVKHVIELSTNGVALNVQLPAPMFTGCTR